MRRLAVAIVLLLVQPVLAQVVQVEASVPAEMVQGGSATASCSFRLLEGPADLSEGVWFLNVVRPVGGGEVEQVTHLLFSRAREDGKLFRTVFSRAELEAGVSGQLEFELRRRAPPGDYVIALQLFNGRVTNPGRVRASERVAMEFVNFTVLPAASGER